MNIREAHKSDLEEIHACVNTAYSHYIERMGKEPAPMLCDYLEAIENELVYVIEDESAVMGVLVLIVSNNQFFLENIAVHKDAQGKCFGKSLLLFAESIALSKGYECIELYTNIKMTENLSLYKYFGYSISKQVEEFGYERVYMKKCLNNE